jgi:hypothetical protein
MPRLRAGLGDGEWNPRVGQRFKREELGPGYRVVAGWPTSQRVVQWR